MAKLRVSYSDRRNGARASVAVEIDLDAATIADASKLHAVIQQQQTYVRSAVQQELYRAHPAVGPSHISHAHPSEPTRPESHAPADADAEPTPDRGDAWEPPFSEFAGQPPAAMASAPAARGRRRPAAPRPEEETDEDIPTDGRQLMGWARKQDPDAIGPLMSFGKSHGFPSKIVTWDPEQVLAAYRHAKGARRPKGH